MDIKDFKRLSDSKIIAGNKLESIRKELKKYKEAKQDAYEGITESLKPIIDVEKSVKESIDKKQDELIEQLQKNEKAITSGLEHIVIYNQLSEKQDTTKLPIDYKPAMMDELQHKYKSDLDKGFNSDDIKTLMEYNLFAPSDILKGVRSKTLDFDDYDVNIGKILQNLGAKKGTLSENKKTRDSNKMKINELTNQIKLLQKYRNRIGLIPEGLKTTVGQSGK